MQNSFFTIDNQRVASVMTTLITHHSRGLIGQEVNDLTLAFITPLGAQNNYVFTHHFISVKKKPTTSSLIVARA